MNKLNLYLFFLSSKYILINLLIISIVAMFLNLIDMSRIINEKQFNVINFAYLSFLKYPNILNEILPFVVIIGISFLFKNLINNNELISMRNIGYSIFDIFLPISMAVFIIGILFLLIINPIASNFEEKFERIINKNNKNLYSIKISNNEMWIKNKLNEDYSSFINIKNINLQNMNAKDIKILLINKNNNKFIQAKEGKFVDNNFILSQVNFYNIDREHFKKIDKFNLKINFNKDSIINSIADYKSIPYYKYLSHSKTLKKFNLYSSEIGLFYISELLKPIFIVMLSFVVLGYSGKFKRSDNFFKVLSISIFVGLLIFFIKEIITKATISLDINFYISYLVIFIIPFSIGLYQVIKIEND